MSNHPREGVRAVRAEEALRLVYIEGLSVSEISARMGISRSYASELLTDPTGTAVRARKDSYRGVCAACGGPTSGGEGPAHVSEFYIHCHGTEHKKWTRDVVIDAIQRFAVANGRPPISTEWIRRDVENDYPARTSVYKGEINSSSSPFDSWADAIEAAGFPRPYKGIKYNVNEGVTQMTRPITERPYIVFKIDGDQITMHGRAVATDGPAAVEAVTESLEGVWASVPEASLTHYEYVVRPSLQRLPKR